MRRRYGFKSLLPVIEQLGSLNYACEACGIPVRAAKAEMKKNPEFADQVEESLQIAFDRLEGEAYRRAIIGVEEPVFYKGRPVHKVRKYSDYLLAKMLSARVPGYGAKVEVSGPGITKIERVVVDR